MNEEFKLLYKNFMKIRELGWVKSLRKGDTGVGYTFEKLLGKEEDSFRIPDYHGIEIKTMKYFSKQVIHLFCATPDGDTLFPIKRIVKEIGYPDKSFPEYKVFMTSVNAKEYSVVGYKRVKLKMNWEKEKIDLVAYSTYGKTYDLETSWSFQMLREIFYLKLNELAIVKACSKTINKNNYFFYSRIDFYKRKEFEQFLKLIEEGIITINFQIGIYRDKEKLGRINNRGTNFSIREKDIPLLFDRI